jgi:hypothetical protein
MTLKYLIFGIFILCCCSGVLLAEGSLVIHCNVPQAKVYLDGNYIATLDARGDLKIDQLPDGKFMLTVQKARFQSQKQMVEVISGQATHLQLDLPPTAPYQSTPKGKGSPRPADEQTMTKSPMPGQSAAQESPSSSVEAPSSWGLKMFLATLAFIIMAALAGSLYFFRDRLTLRFRYGSAASDRDSTMENTESDDPIYASDPGPSESDPAFLAELEHREEMLRAGFLTDPHEKKKRRRPSKKTTVILKKDDYEIKE